MSELARGIVKLESRSKIAVGLIFAYIAAEAVMIVISIAISAGLLGLEPGSSTLVNLTMFELVVFAAYLLSAIAVGFWIHRAHANLFDAGLDGLEFSPGWSVGWFFVPFASLFKPFQAMRELLNRSQGDHDSYGAEAPGNLGVWWGCFLGGNVIANLSANAIGQSAAGSNAALTFGVLSSLLMIVSAWLLKGLIEQVGAGQRSMLGIAEAFA